MEADMEIQKEESVKVKKKKKLSNLVSTFFRNALRSNLDLTSLADTKAGILISINGFILTVSVTASSFVIHNEMMTYAFISIILTSLGSIILAVLAVKPRHKKQLVNKNHLDGYSSLLYYQDMADLAPAKYESEMKKALFSSKKSTQEMITHLHILGAEIKKKYFWLKQAYTFFSLGLIISASLIIYALMYVEKKAFYNLANENVIYKEDKFYNIFEPSAATTLPDGKVLIGEDESGADALKLIEVQEDSSIVEVGTLYMSKKIKKQFKKNIEDLEALTSDGNTIYGATSHSLNRTNKEKKSREKLMMFEYVDGAIEDFHLYSDLKKDLYTHFPDIFKETLFGVSTLSIEGLCYEDESLIIGFRSPVPEGKAMLIAIENPREVFLKDEKPRFSKPQFLNLNGLGIRDIVYDTQKNGFWIIAGGSDERNSNFQLWYWDKKNSKLSIVKNHPEIGYGEGITIINKNSMKPALLIVEDNGKKPNKSAGYIIIDRNSL
jgi:hypothetical protein